MSSGTGRAGKVYRALVLLLGIAFVAACTPIYSNHGYLPTEEDVDEIMVGLDTRETVGAIVGQPGTAGLLTEDAWYYVQSRFEQSGIREKKEVEREVLRISFDDKGVVENIERFGLEEGRVVVLSRRVTTSNTQGIGFLKQLLGGVGQINLSDILN